MRILLVNKYLMPKGGAETYVFELGKQLELMGHKVQYFGMDHSERIVGNRAGAYVKYMDFHSKGINKLLYPFKIIYSREAKKEITKILYDFKPDIIHLNNFNYQLTPSLIYAVRRAEKELKMPMKIVFTAHDVQLACPNHMMNNLVTHENCEKCVDGSYYNCIKDTCIHGSRLRSVLGALEGYLYRKLRTYKHIDLMVYPSQFICDKLSKVPELKNNHVVLHNFVIDKSVKLMDKEDYVLFFGRYSYEKGLETLVKACNELKYIPFKFAGSGPLEKMVNDAENIENVGFQTGDKLKTLISKARFSILPSEWYENCPFSIIESISCHTPVIAARIGGIPELITQGKTGLMFESGNVKDLKENIQKLWSDKELQLQMTNNCESTVFDDANIYTEKLIECYKSIM